MSRTPSRGTRPEQMELSQDIARERDRLRSEGKRPIAVRLSPAMWELYLPVWQGMPVRAAAGLRAELGGTVDEFEIVCGADGAVPSDDRG